MKYTLATLALVSAKSPVVTIVENGKERELYLVTVAGA